MPHTPGPWYLSMRPSGDELDGPDGGQEYDQREGVFAVVDDEIEILAKPFLEADARLIAAAPRCSRHASTLSPSCAKAVAQRLRARRDSKALGRDSGLGADRLTPPHWATATAARWPLLPLEER